MKQRGIPYEVRLFAGKTDPMNSGFWLPLWMLFPAHAGVILVSNGINVLRTAFPRPCGGDPSRMVKTTRNNGFSPPMRG